MTQSQSHSLSESLSVSCSRVSLSLYVTDVTDTVTVSIVTGGDARSLGMTLGLAEQDIDIIIFLQFAVAYPGI